MELCLNTPLTNELLEEVAATAGQVRQPGGGDTNTWKLMQELVQKLAIDVGAVQLDDDDDGAGLVVHSVASESVGPFLDSIQL